MNKILRNACAALALCLATGATAQNLQTAYFLEGHAYGHEPNPAKDYDRKAYVSFPFLGNLNVGLQGNLNLQDFLYKNPNGSGLVTYLHPSISAAEALSGFSKHNKLMADTRITLLSAGFHTRRAYHTLTVGLRANAAVNVPYALFDLTKDLQNKDYDIGRMGMQATTWTEAGYGHSRQINEEWRVGGKMKVLLGLARMNLKGDNLKLHLADENQWTATANATLELGAKGMTWGQTKTTTNNAGETYEEIDLDNIDIDGFQPNGMGLALDLGAEWDMKRILPGLKLSGALLDLGFIRWSETLVARNSGKPFVFNGFQNVQVSDGPGTPIKEQYNSLTDDLEDLYRLQPGDGNKGSTRMLGATLNLAAEYRLPAYDRLRFGLLSTTRIQGRYSWNEERLSASVSPCRAFEAAASLGLGTMGASFGWVINVHPKGFNLFLGMDRTVGKLSKQGIPLRSNVDLTLGINFPLGTKE